MNQSNWFKKIEKIMRISTQELRARVARISATAIIGGPSSSVSIYTENCAVISSDYYEM